MPRRCTICDREDLAEINRALLMQSHRHVAGDFDLSESSVFRHKAHMTRVVKEAINTELDVLAKEELARTVPDFPAMWMDLRDRAETILNKAEAVDDLRTATSALRELRGVLDMPLRYGLELQKRGQAVALLQHPEWTHLRTVLVHALADHPDARQAVIVAISHMEST